MPLCHWLSCSLKPSSVAARTVRGQSAACRALRTALTDAAAAAAAGTQSEKYSETEERRYLQQNKPETSEA